MDLIDCVTFKLTLNNNTKIAIRDRTCLENFGDFVKPAKRSPGAHEISS